MRRQTSSGSSISAVTRAQRNEIIKSKKIFSEISLQAAAPSKDWCSAVVNDKGVIWRRWYISPATARIDAAAQKAATESVCTLDDFIDGDFHREIAVSLGDAVLQQLLDAAAQARE
eukprot:m.97465 g.97465  ORF g.97465 m.97465 type:complete len:116 (+) comp16700_c0_seq1:200-547(+)